MNWIRAIVAVVVIGLAAYAIFFHKATGSDASGASRTVTWLLSHQPTDVFARAADVFDETLQRESGGSLSLVLMKPEDIGVEKGDVPHAKVLEQLSLGTADIASVYTIPLGNEYQDFQMLNLPFLFGSYEEANASLDGAALSILDTRMDNVRGLAFTMSGGLRIIASRNTDIRKMSDLKGKRIATSGGAVAEATLVALGAIPVPLDLENDGSRDFSSIDGVETTYARLSTALGSNTAFTSHINETNHSVFLTAIIASDTFFDSLTPVEQAALISAARAAAKVERQDSIALNATVKEALRAKGSTVNEISPVSHQEFVNATKAVYREFMSRFSPDVYDAVVGER